MAVKVVPAEGTDPERAQREARAVARLDHEGIVALFDAGEEDGCRYLVSELVEGRGRPLAQLEADGALSDRDVLRIGLALTDALAHAHDRGVIHRDVKPQNVIVPDDAGSRRGAAKLTDFGVAHLTGEDALSADGRRRRARSPTWRPSRRPAPAAGEHADLYALGIVLYEALAGVHPVRAGSPTATARRIGTVLAPLARHRADLPDGLCAAIDRAVLPAPGGARRARGPLRRARRGASAESPTRAGVIAPHPIERRRGVLLPLATRLAAPAATGALAYAALRRAYWPATRCRAAGRRGGGAAVLTLIWPRVGWLATASGVAGLLASGPAPGLAPPCSCCRAPAPALLLTRGRPRLGAARARRAAPRASGWPAPARRWLAGPFHVKRSAAAAACGADGRAAGRVPAAARRSLGPGAGAVGAAPTALAGSATRAGPPARGSSAPWAPGGSCSREPLLERALVLGPAPGDSCTRLVRRRRRHHRRRRDRARDELRRTAARRGCGAPPRSSCRGWCGAAR